MKYLVYVAIAVFTFAVGVGISPIRFYGESTARGPRSSSIAYRSSYFMQTSFSYINYETEQEAKDAFNERLKKAVKVIDLSPKVNKRGVLIEQRAVGNLLQRRHREVLCPGILERRKNLVLHQLTLVHAC